MEKKFYEWYRYVNIAPTSETLEKRWQAIGEYCDKDNFDIFGLTKMFFGLKAEEEFVEEFVDYFQQADTTFLSKNQKELSLLAGVILANLIENNTEKIKILLSIKCLVPFNDKPIVSEIIEIIMHEFDEVTMQSREELSNSVVNNILVKTIRTLSDELKATPSMTADRINELAEVLKIIADNFNRIKSQQVHISELLDVYREDSNILAWIIGETSNDTNRKLNGNVQQNKIALILGKELADLILTIPGPYPARAFLKKMLDYCKAERSKLSLVSIIDLADLEWRKGVASQIELLDSSENTPILLAVLKSVEASEPEVWKHAYKQITSYDPETICNDVLTWSYQIYLECLLLKA